MKRVIARLSVGVAVLALIGALGVYALLRTSLPAIEGEISTAGIAADVDIDRDEFGVPLITAIDRRDLAYGTGFVHAQDRFFQMDLLRRNSAGELAEIFGAVALDADRRHRLHRFRSRAEAILNRFTTAELDLLGAYAAGVNDGLASLGSRPFEYHVLRVEPEPWVMADTLLVVFSMYLDLHDERADRDVQRGLAHSVLPAEVFAWLYPETTEWDAPLMGEPGRPAAVPPPATYTLAGTQQSREVAPRIENAEPALPGSNNWAVAGDLTHTGRAIVANDMHLGLAVPNIFYRARLRTLVDDSVDLTGVTLPGVPLLVAGSNGYVAWGNTNSYGDWSDAVLVIPGPEPGTYVTPSGPRPFAEYEEVIEVKDGEPETLTVRETIWGPVRDDLPSTAPETAVSWIAHDVEAVNLAFLLMEKVRSVDEAIVVANMAGLPPQNFVVGDSAGNIAWTIAGRIPERTDYDSSLPADWSREPGWRGMLPPEEYPYLMNPEGGRIWTANARVADGDALRIIGNGGYDLGARAGQIRDGLFARTKFAPGDMLEIQLDDRALFLERWRRVLLEVLDAAAVAGSDERARYRSLAENWTPRAAPESAGYRLVRAFRTEVRDRVFTMLMQPVYARYGEETRLRMSNRFEGPLWSLVTERPAHLLTEQYEDWDELLLGAVDANIAYFGREFDGGLEQRTWGERNTAAIRHPLSRALPFLSRWLDMPAVPLFGDFNLPRAQSPTFGASERFAVSPGLEEDGYLHMPAGQSGHPLSDFYRYGHDDWVAGRPGNFAPGRSVAHLTLVATPP